MYRKSLNLEVAKDVIVTLRDSCCPIGCDMRHVLEILCRVFSEPTYGLKVSFIIKPVCSCTKPQRYSYFMYIGGQNSAKRIVYDHKI